LLVFDIDEHCWSLLSFRRPQCISLRSVNVRSTLRFRARSTSMRECIRKSRPSAAAIRQPIAVCHSGRSCSAFVEQNRWAFCRARPAEKGAAQSVQRESARRASVVICPSPKMVRRQCRNPPSIKALAEVRRLAPRERWRYRHVQAIIVTIDQYAEAALGNREFFLNKPYGIGGGSKDNIP